MADCALPGGDNNICTDSERQVKIRNDLLSKSTSKLQRIYGTIINSILCTILWRQLQSFLLSQAIRSLFSRQEQDRIGQCDKKELIDVASRLWYSATFREELPRLLDKNLKDNSVPFLSKMDKLLHEYFKETGRVVFDQDKRDMLIVCDTSYSHFSAAQYEELYVTAFKATPLMRRTMNSENIYHCNIAESFSFQLAPSYEDSEQESSHETDSVELCTPNSGYWYKAKTVDQQKWPCGPDDTKRFVWLADFRYTIVPILRDPGPDPGNL